MEGKTHPSIGHNVVLGSNNRIEPTAVIEGDVEIGSHNYIGHYAVLRGRARIGNGNYIGEHVTIGSEAQHSVWRWELNERPIEGRMIEIGNDCILREYVTVHMPTESRTTIGNSCHLLAYSHVPHDAILEEGVILSNNVQIGGHVWIGSYANLGFSTVVHPRTSIGGFVMIGMATVVNRDIPPFVMAYGNPVQVTGLNVVGLERNGFSIHDQECIRIALQTIPDEGTCKDMIQTVDQRIAEAVIKFTSHSKRPRRNLPAGK